MTTDSCRVFETYQALSDLLSSGRLTHPRCRQRTEDMLKLLEDISMGSGSREHLEGLEALAAAVIAEAETLGGAEPGRIVQERLGKDREVFLSHVETHNCPTGDCAVLTPAPCQMACPAGIDVPGYVTLIGQGKYAEAVELIRRDNPFPWVCGLVCTHPCEFMCVRGRIDTAVAIKDLKAFAAERAMSEGSYRNPPKAPDNGHKVAVIGAGPAGLTAAYYLALKGYRVTVIEALPVAGGMMMVGIPRYRLPREVIDREVAMIEELGVEFRYNTRLGKDTSLDELREEGFEAFFVAIGAHACYRMGIKGEEEYPQIFDAVSFLLGVALGDHHKPGDKVAVIGGGNVAIDAARTCIRLGCREVTILYRRTRAEMPASVEEVEQAEEEGVRFHFLTIPVEAEGKDGVLTGLRCLRAELGEADATGRRRPIPVEGSDHVFRVDTVITAIGQYTNPRDLESYRGLQWTKRTTLVADTVTCATGAEGVFAGGDLVLGPATVVEAIGAGKRAAAAIDRYLQGLPQPALPPVPIRRQRLPCLEVPASTKMALRRPEMPLLGAERRRITFQQVELGYDESMAVDEAKRCLRCDICIRCGRCVEICRDKMKINALELGYFDFDQPGPTDLRVAAERCILCGACAANCPTGAMQMEDLDGERILRLCGTVLNRLELEYCEECGAVLGPSRYHDYVSKRIQQVGQYVGDRRVCVECTRKILAEQHADISPPPRLAT